VNFINQLHWRPGIGDPTFMGWLTVAAYALAALTAWKAALRAKRMPGTVGGSHGTWWLVSLRMTFLCLNKQLDLQSLFTDIGRVIAWNQGWYQERRELQKWFVIGLLGVSFFGGGFVLVWFRSFWLKHILLAVGLLFLLTFIVVRAVSFHHIDLLLKSRIAGVKMNWFLELTGIGLVWLAAWIDYRNPARAPKPPWKPAV